MAILKPVIVPAKALKGGRHKVRISVSHNGDSRYIVTDIILNSDKEFKGGQIVKRHDAAILNTKLRGILQRYQASLDALEYIEGLTCPELVSQLKNADKCKHRTLASIYEEYMDFANLKPGTRYGYKSIFKNLVSYIGASMIIDNINHSTILSIDKRLRKRGMGQNAIRSQMGFLATLLNYAKRCGYVTFRVDPFFGYSLPPSVVRQSWLSVEQVRTIRDFVTSDKKLAKCRDLFMLSYYLGGINMTDLMDVNFAESGDTLKYARKKTENRPKLNMFVEFTIPEEAKPIISRHIGADGRLLFTKGQRTDVCHGFLSYNMRRLANALNIPNLVYYSARKSFSQHAYQLGARDSTIDYILGHRVDKGGTALYSYITVTPEIATQTVRLVLDNLKIDVPL